MKIKIGILGATGSIGKSAVDVISKESDKFEISFLTANTNIEALIKIAKDNNIKDIILADDKNYSEYKKNIPKDINFKVGFKEIVERCSCNDTDIIINAIVGAAGFKPTKAALLTGKRVALANKETMVSYGEIINKLCKEFKGEIIPVDSEHSAIFQLLENKKENEIKNLIITASGGSLRNHPNPGKASLKQVLKHPTWNMGKKITVDSASLANKGLEVIEASRLFNLKVDKIQVVIHPTSIVHSLVEFIDGSIFAQLAEPDMRLPIQYAINYPKRQKKVIQELDLIKASPLNFYKPDFIKFPALKLAYNACKEGGTMPAVFNAANEVAASLFINNNIEFAKIPEYIEKIMDRHKISSGLVEENVDRADYWARESTIKLFKKDC